MAGMLLEGDIDAVVESIRFISTPWFLDFNIMAIEEKVPFTIFFYFVFSFFLQFFVSNIGLLLTMIASHSLLDSTFFSFPFKGT